MEKSCDPSNFAVLAFQVRILATAHDVITSTQKMMILIMTSRDSYQIRT